MNEDKFTGKAKLYAAFRPSYPDSLIDRLYDIADTDSAADIGAGTGIFTRCLLKKDWNVTAVEPNPDMYTQLKLSLDGTNAGIICASAEHTGLEGSSIGLVTAAQAFHWFDEKLFRAECQRILKPGGRLAVIWNERCDTGISRERDRLCRQFCEAFRSGHDGRRHNTDCGTFLRNEYFSRTEYFCTDNIVTMDEERFIGDTLSRSHALKETDENFPHFCKELRKIFSKYAMGGVVAVPYKTTCYAGKF